MKQTGGDWNPANRPLFFFAGSYGRLHFDAEEWLGVDANRFANTTRVAEWSEDVPNPGSMKEMAVNRNIEGNQMFGNLFAVNDFADVNKPLDRRRHSWGEFEASIQAGIPTFLDSGVFYLTNVHKRNHSTSMDEALALAPEEIDNFDWLFDTYVELVNEYGDRLWGYNELDQGGMANKIRMRAKLEDLGLAPIPVYHPINDGWDYFDELAQGYDRICFGNVVQAPPGERRRLLMTAYQRHLKYPDLFIHFLGLTPNELQAGMPFDSADSSMWTYTFRYPHSVRLSAMGHKRWQLSPDLYTPMKADPATRVIAGNVTVADQWAVIESLVHWQARLESQTGLVRYPAPETVGVDL